jgi:hypothetical protein
VGFSVEELELKRDHAPIDKAGLRSPALFFKFVNSYWKTETMSYKKGCLPETNPFTS